MNKTILYYTCNTHRLDIELACRKQLLKANLPIISVSLNKEIDFGDFRIILKGERSPLMMHKQILAGLQLLDKYDVGFLCESDVLYHPSHFEINPISEDTFYYNTNVWKVRYPDGHAVWTDDLQQVSGCCGYMDVLFEFYFNRIKQIENEGFNRHYEPGVKQSVGSKLVENWQSEFPNIDIRHDKNITLSKWSVDEYRNKQYAKGWTESSEVPHWGVTEGRFIEFLTEI